MNNFFPALRNHAELGFGERKKRVLVLYIVVHMRVVLKYKTAFKKQLDFI